MNEFTEQREAFKRIYEDKEVADLLFKKIHDDIIPIEKPAANPTSHPTRSLTE